MVFNEEFKIITVHLQAALKHNYEYGILRRVNAEKKRMIQKWAKRKDYDAILRVVSNEGESNKTEFNKSDH